MIDASVAYVEVMERVCEMLATFDQERSATPVPACPGWTVHDVIAHHCGVLVDIVTGDLGDLGQSLNLMDQWRDPVVAGARDALTARQVRERQARSLDAIVAEWQEATDAFVPMLRNEVPFPVGVPALFGVVAINDVVVHEGDVRLALGLDQAPDGAALSLALGGYGFSLDLRLREVGLPPIALAYDGKERRLGGDGTVGATVHATRFDLVRTLASRRTREQILALDWSGDAEPYVSVLPEYGPTFICSDK